MSSPTPPPSSGDDATRFTGSTPLSGGGDDPTNVGAPYGQSGSPSYGQSGQQPGGYDGGQGYGQGYGDKAPGGYDAGQGGQGYGAGQGGQGGYGQGGQGGYGGGDWNGGGYGQGGYGGYDAGSTPPGGQGGGKGKWIAIWSGVAVLVIVVALVVLYLTVWREDGSSEEGGGGGDETPTEEAPEFTLNAYNDIEVVDGVATIEFEADRDDIVVLSTTQEDLGDPEGVDFSDSTFALYQDWDDGEGLAAWTVADGGDQTVELPYEGSDEVESISVYVNVLDGDPIAVGDEIELPDTEEGDPAPVAAAVIEDLDGTYVVPDTMWATNTNDGEWRCHDTEGCDATGNGFAMVTEAGLAFEVADASTGGSGDTGGSTGGDSAAGADAEWTGEGGVSDAAPLSDPQGSTPATWAKTFSVTTAGELTVDIDSQYEQQDVAVVVTDSGGNPVCQINERGVGEDEYCTFQAAVGTFTATVTATGSQLPSAEPEGAIVGYLY